jgi:Recombination endonuclease VII
MGPRNGVPVAQARRGAPRGDERSCWHGAAESAAPASTRKPTIDEPACCPRSRSDEATSPLRSPSARTMETRQQQRQRAWFAKRWAEDPQFRARRRATQRAWKVAHRDELNLQRRHRYATDPEFRARKIAASSKDNRRRRLKRKYGISLEEYERLLALQNGACAICLLKSDRMLHVDHCHKTGRVRGLLCVKCNTGLGCYNDDPSLMRRGAAYLERSWQQSTDIAEQDRV